VNLKAVIFDLDGTLLDTLTDIALSANAVLEKYGFEGHPVDAYRYFVGEGMDVMVKKVFPPEDDWDYDLDIIFDQVKEEYAKRWKDHTVPYRGIADLLNYLEENQVAKAVFSNKPHQFAELTVKTLLPVWKFVAVVGVSSNTPKKPDPRGALKIAEKMNLKPGQVVYLGDTHTDMQTAVNGRFFPVGALWGFRDAEELTNSGARFLADNPEDIIKLFAADNIL